jgi:hypothetical protein
MYSPPRTRRGVGAAGPDHRRHGGLPPGVKRWRGRKTAARAGYETCRRLLAASENDDQGARHRLGPQPPGVLWVATGADPAPHGGTWSGQVRVRRFITLRNASGGTPLPPAAHDLPPTSPTRRIAMILLARLPEGRGPGAWWSGRARACCEPGALPCALLCSNRGSMTSGGRDEHTHPHGRAERSTPHSRTAGPRTGKDTSGGNPPGGTAAARLRSGGATRAGPPPAGTNDLADSAHVAGFADPAGAAPVPRGAASTGHRHRRWAPRRAALTKGT